MYANLVFFVIALATIDSTFGGVLYFEPRSSGAANNIPCPDGGSCADNNTCCMLESLRYGCCPMPRV